MQINQPKTSKSKMRGEIKKWSKLASVIEAKMPKTSRCKTRPCCINTTVYIHITLLI